MNLLDKIESKSDRGLSTVTVTIKPQYTGADLPQVWDELRRKVSDAQANLPPGAGPSVVIDDYGDVFGVFLTVSGGEYSYAELKKVIDLLQHTNTLQGSPVLVRKRRRHHHRRQDRREAGPLTPRRW